MTGTAKGRNGQRWGGDERSLRRVERPSRAQRVITLARGQQLRQDDLARTHVGEVRRARIISAMVELSNENGDETASRVITAAKVSRRTFYELFKDYNDCLVAALEWGIALVGERVSAAYNAHERWVDSVRAGLCELLRFFDEQPALASLCVVRSASAGPVALSLRWETLDRLTRVIDQGRNVRRRELAPMTAEGVVGGILSLIERHLLEPDAGPLLDLLNPLMSMIVLPYLGEAAARKELSRPAPAAIVAPTPEPAARNPLEQVNLRFSHRTVAVLHVIADEPGLSNRAISERSGIVDQAQISRLLARLEAQGLMQNSSGGVGTTNCWRLTPLGEQIERMIWGRWPSTR